MPSRALVLNVQVPRLDTFAKRYPHYRAFAEGEGRFLFDLVMAPEAFIRARVATEDLDLPAVAGIARLCFDAVGAQGTVPWSRFVKQYIGALTAVLMEANGFAKKGQKRSVPFAAFSRAECYVRQSAVSPQRMPSPA